MKLLHQIAAWLLQLAIEKQSKDHQADLIVLEACSGLRCVDTTLRCVNMSVHLICCDLSRWVSMCPGEGRVVPAASRNFFFRSPDQGAVTCH